MDIEETIKRVRTGDTTALKKLIEAYSPMLRKVCFNITHEDEDTLNDLVQVAFIRAYPNLQPSDDGVLIFANKNLEFDVFAIEFGCFGVVYP